MSLSSRKSAKCSAAQARATRLYLTAPPPSRDSSSHLAGPCRSLCTSSLIWPRAKHAPWCPQSACGHPCTHERSMHLLPNPWYVHGMWLAATTSPGVHTLVVLGGPVGTDVGPASRATNQPMGSGAHCKRCDCMLRCCVILPTSAARKAPAFHAHLPKPQASCWQHPNMQPSTGRSRPAISNHHHV